MKALIQRVKHSSVTIDGQLYSKNWQGNTGSSWC